MTVASSSNIWLLVTRWLLALSVIILMYLAVTDDPPTITFPAVQSVFLGLVLFYLVLSAVLLRNATGGLGMVVGAVSVVLGLTGLVAAIGNWDRYYQLDKVRWLETFWGRRGVRLIYGVVGMLLIALGVAIAMGFGPNKSAAQSSRTPRTQNLPGLGDAI